MKKIKKGDIVGRISYGKDILFVVDRIIKTNSRNEIAILKGLTIRIKADSNIEDLEVIEKRIVKEKIQLFENRIEDELKKCLKYIELDKRGKDVLAGKILHLDGDKKYSEKSLRCYRSLGLEAIVKNIKENEQVRFVKSLLERYRPDILVITGHDGMLRGGTKYNDIYNYRNSRSLIIAEKIATTDESKYVTISDIERNLRDGIKGVNGIGAMGKKKIVTKM